MSYPAGGGHFLCSILRPWDHPSWVKLPLQSHAKGWRRSYLEYNIWSGSPVKTWPYRNKAGKGARSESPSPTPTPPNPSGKWEWALPSLHHMVTCRRRGSLSQKGFESLWLKGLRSLRTEGYKALLYSLKHYYCPGFWSLRESQSFSSYFILICKQS